MAETDFIAANGEGQTGRADAVSALADVFTARRTRWRPVFGQPRNCMDLRRGA